jgi:hypothetical protein
MKTKKKSTKKKSTKRVLFFDARGKFVSARQRYDGLVDRVMVSRGRRYVEVFKKVRSDLNPQQLANVTTRQEFESLPESYMFKGELKPKSKYQVWDIANKLDSMKGIRRKLLKVDVMVEDGKRLKVMPMYHIIKSNKKSSYHIFRRINDLLGANNMFTYDRIGSKLLADRRGKKVRIKGIRISEVL